MRNDTHARLFLAREIYAFNELEKSTLKLFFTNSSRPVCLMHTLPMAVGDVLLSMYSRLKNPRGLRGVFVDNFLPQFLSASIPEVENQFGGDPEKFLKARELKTLEKFAAHSPETRQAFQDFLRAFSIDADYIQRFCESRKVKRFLEVWLDKYGHNSIARMAGGIWICFEQVSVLAAKTIEWTRPGSGYIELSTRYVDMAGKDIYPAAEEIGEYGVDPGVVRALLETSFDYYRHFQGANFDGPFPRFLRETYGGLYADALKDLEAGVFGETCDVLGNFLPAATLTSVGVSTSGESLPQLVKHLLLDNTPETRTLAALVAEEGQRIGIQQFLRHTEPTQWQKMSWEYLDVEHFGAWGTINLHDSTVFHSAVPPPAWTEKVLVSAFRLQPSFLGVEASAISLLL